MKQLLVVTFILTGCICLAQESSKYPKPGRVGITFSLFGNNDLIRFQQLEGASSLEGEGFYSIGVAYVYPLNKWLDLETGLEFSKHHITSSAMEEQKDISLFTVPITGRANFLKYLFLNGGFLLDINVGAPDNIHNQSGIGAVLGIAGQYDFDSGISFFVNPYVKGHALLPFSPEDYHQRLIESGIRLGVAYVFD